MKQTWWKVPQMWVGKTVVVLASGQSMNHDVADTVHASGCPAIAINDTFRLASWADVLYAADSAWWICNSRDALQFKGLKVSVSETPFQEVLRLKNSGHGGFDDNPAALRTGGNSGYQAVHLAAHAGAKRILLCGMDMHGKRWHGNHPQPLRNPGESVFPRWLRWFQLLAPELEKRGIECINCTPGSALRIFDYQPLEQALAECAAPSA
jgi:hypothetical protein